MMETLKGIFLTSIYCAVPLTITFYALKKALWRKGRPDDTIKLYRKIVRNGQ